MSIVFNIRRRTLTNIFKSISYLLQATTGDEDLPKNLSSFITFGNNGEQWYV